LNKVVVDASVIAKWSFPEPYSEAALRLLEQELELWVPDFVWAEIGNIVWKKWIRNEIVATDGRLILLGFRSFPFSVYPSERLLETAWEIARDFRRSFYDSLYLALAIYQGCPLVTADRRLYNAVGGASSRLPILWVEDIP
jgi:predicted nucleic acid-binding protein